MDIIDISCVKYEFVMGITGMKQFDSERLRSGRAQWAERRR